MNDNLEVKNKESFADIVLTETQISQIVNKVLEDYENDKNARKDWEDKKAEIFKRYRNESVRVPPYSGGSDIVSPVMQQNIDAILPRATNAFINTPYVVFTGTEENDKEKARNTEKLFNFYLEKEVNYPQLIEDLHADGVPYGTAWVIDYLDPDTKLPQIAVVALEDVFVPYFSYCDINELPHVIRRYYKPTYEINDKYGFELKGDKVELTPLPEAKDEVEGMVNLDADADLPVECVKWYGRLKINGKMKDVVIDVAVTSRKLLERFYLNETVPYADNERRLPINRIRFKAIKGRTYGVGMGDDLSPLHDWYCSTVNQIIDATNWSIIPFGAFRAGSTFNPKKFEIKHGMMIPLDDINDIKFFNVPNNAVGAQNMLPVIESNIERSSAISDYNQGRESSNNTSPTWRGTAAILQESMIRIDSYIKRTANSMKYTLENLYYWLQATMSQEDIIRIMGTTDENVINTLNDSLSMKYDLSVNVNYGYWNRDNDRENAINLAKLFLPDPQVMANKELSTELKKDIFKAVGKDRLAELLDNVNAESNKQQKENARMIQGESVPASMDDDHKKHIAEIDTLENQEVWEKLSEGVKNEILGHKQEHVNYFEQLKNEIMADQVAQMQVHNETMTQGQPVEPMPTNISLPANPQEAAAKEMITPPVANA